MVAALASDFGVARNRLEARGVGCLSPVALKLVLAFLTGGLFYVVSIFRQSAWVRRIDPTCKALFVMAVAFPAPLIMCY